MTREELTRIICPKSMTSRCEEKLDCNYCKEKMNKWLEEHDKQIINDFVKAFNEFMNTSRPCGFYEECYDSPTGDCIDCFKEKWLKENK